MGSLNFSNSVWTPISRVDDWLLSFRIGRRNVSLSMPTIPRANTSHQRHARFLSSYLRQSRLRTRAKQFQADSEARPGFLTSWSLLLQFQSFRSPVARGGAAQSENCAESRLKAERRCVSLRAA